MQFTPSQSKALSQKRHLAIVANAGSGKTRVLVQRYVDILEARPDLDARNVAAITFTENAASELNARISKEVGDRLVSVGRESPERRRRLLAIRDSLSSAFVGTIHSFSSRILRAYPVEANVDSGFGILQGADRGLLEDEAIDRVFYSVLDEAFANDPDGAVLRLFRRVGRHNVLRLTKKMLANRDRVEQLHTRVAGKLNSSIVQNWQSAIEREIRLPFEPGTERLFEELLLQKTNGKMGTEAEDAYHFFVSSKGFFERCQAFEKMASCFFTQKGGVNLKRIKRDALNPETLAEAAHYCKSIDEMHALLASLPASEQEFVDAHTEYVTHLRTLLELYETVHEEYAATKATYGLLDFDDLIEKAKRLLGDPRVREELSEQFAYLMIDEYQDTDQSQFEIARLLSNNFGGDTNIALVGDPKQSIYSFRNAEAEVFHKSRTAIGSQLLTQSSEAESIELSLSPAEERGHLTLRESFRMTASPLAFINLVFQSLLGGDDGGEYADLVAARETTEAGSVEWIVAPEGTSRMFEEEGEELFEDASEAELIAKTLRHIVRGRASGYRVEEGLEARSAKFSDIAILLRSRGNLTILERALREEGVPYQVSKGSGFYVQQEILDVTSYLEFLVTPSNDIALAAILRSPFFALSDVDLFQIAHHSYEHREEFPETAGFWDKLQRYVAQNEKPHLKRAVDQLSDNLRLAGRTSTAFLIEKIYAETAIFATLGSLFNGSQKCANLDKLLHQAREADRTGFSSLFDFTERVRYLIEQEENESQAVPGASIDAVQIMTVHAAKGLEFPIVVVPFLQKTFQFDSANIIDKDLGILLKFSDEEAKTPIAELIRLRAKRSTIEEEKRILYVALTRARDHLILSSTCKKSSKESWLNWMNPIFPELMGEAEAIERTCSVERYNATDQSTSLEQISLTIPIVRSADNIPDFEEDASSTEVAPITKSYLFPLPILHPQDRFSATQFLTERECPTKYHLLYDLGIPEEPKLAPDLSPDEYSERIRGAMLGQIVHTVLDRIEKIAPSGTLDLGQYHFEIDKAFRSLRVFNDPEQHKYRNAVLVHVQNVLQSPIAIELFASSSSRTEFPVQALIHSGDILYGIVDRLYKTTDGIWTVLDYKTDTTKSEKRRQKKSERHHFQLRFYAALVAKQLQVDRIRGALLYTADGRVESYDFSLADFASLDSDCSSLIAEIRKNEAVRSLRDLPRNLEHCPDCSFYDSHKKKCIVLTAELSKSYRQTSQIAELV